MASPNLEREYRPAVVWNTFGTHGLARNHILAYTHRPSPPASNYRCKYYSVQVLYGVV